MVDGLLLGSFALVVCAAAGVGPARLAIVRFVSDAKVVELSQAVRSVTNAFLARLQHELDDFLRANHSKYKSALLVLDPLLDGGPRNVRKEAKYVVVLGLADGEGGAQIIALLVEVFCGELRLGC